MKKETIHGRSGYDIPCINNLVDNPKMVVIISHGFGSSKESPTAKAVVAALSEHKIGTCSFDFPAHGDSSVDGEKLRIDNCLNDLASVEDHVSKLQPNAEIGYFSSSFGAYINLIYLATCPHLGKKSFLRCAAVDMPGLFKKMILPEQYAQLETQGYTVMNDDYIRPLKIMKSFYDDLEGHDIFKLFCPNRTKLAMIHGDADETAPIEDARRFAKQFNINLTEVKGGDHRFTIPGGMDQVINAAILFFTEKRFFM